MTPKVKIAMEQIARLRIAGIRDAVIAAKMGYTQGGLSRILALPEYQELEDAVLHGTVSKMDEALAGRADALRAYLDQAVPVALRTLFETCVQRRDLRAAMSAAGEILDRDPAKTFAKGRVALQADAPQVSEEMLSSVAADADKVAGEAQKKVVN